MRSRASNIAASMFANREWMFDIRVLSIYHRLCKQYRGNSSHELVRLLSHHRSRLPGFARPLYSGGVLLAPNAIFSRCMMCVHFPYHSIHSNVCDQPWFFFCSLKFIALTKFVELIESAANAVNRHCFKWNSQVKWNQSQSIINLHFFFVVTAATRGFLGAKACDDYVQCEYDSGANILMPFKVVEIFTIYPQNISECAFLFPVCSCNSVTSESKFWIFKQNHKSHKASFWKSIKWISK